MREPGQQGSSLVQEVRTLAATPKVDIGHAEVSLGEFRVGGLSPRPDPLYRPLGIRLGARSHRDEVVGEGAMSAVMRLAASHVARDAVGRGRDMFYRQRPCVAVQASLPVIRDRVGRPLVRIVAGPAPQGSIRLAVAGTELELFEMANHLEATRGGTHSITRVDGKDFLETHPGLEVAKGLAGIEHPQLAAQVALFANAITFDRRQFGGIDNGVGRWLGEVGGAVAMTAPARNRLQPEIRSPVAVEAQRHYRRSVGMAPEAFGQHGPVEVGSRMFLESGGHVPASPLGVVGERRLVHRPADTDQVPEGGVPGTDHEFHRIGGGESVAFDPLDHARIGPLDSKGGSRERVLERTGRLLGADSDRAAHARFEIPGNLLRMALRTGGRFTGSRWYGRHGPDRQCKCAARTAPHGP